MSADVSPSGTAGTRDAERCAWCGAPLGGDAPRLEGRVLCPACGAATTDPWPTDAELDQAYSRYRPRSGRFSGPGDAIFRRTRGALARRLDRIAPAGPVLDVGAGDGALVDALRALGREATGLERNPERADLAAREIADVDGEWAAVVFGHSLEHLRAPGPALRPGSGAPGRVTHLGAAHGLGATVQGGFSAHGTASSLHRVQSAKSGPLS